VTIGALGSSFPDKVPRSGSAGRQLPPGADRHAADRPAAAARRLVIAPEPASVKDSEQPTTTRPHNM